MKKILACLLSLSALGTHAQTLKEFFADESQKTVWLGLDFSQARLINDPAGVPEVMVQNVFPSINGLVISEPKKYNPGEAFSHATMDHDFTGVERNYGQINPDSLRSTKTTDATRLTVADIKRVVAGLDMGGQSGIGLLLVVEGLDKSDKKLTAWATIVDMNTHTVLLTERLEGHVGNGFGERNYWASGFKNLLDEIKDHHYKVWAKKYS